MVDRNRKVINDFYYLRNASKSVNKILVGNKADMESQRKVTYEQGKEFADTYNMKFIETSAKTSFNVEDAFVTMTKEIIAQNEEKKKAGTVSGNNFFIIF